MTREEVRTFLNGTKVYVDGKSREIQEKLFSLGYYWNNKIKVVQYEKKPFLFINEDCITYSDDVVYFKKEVLDREISADEILSIKVTESKYRPFKDKDECWQEMMKHQPFGWIIDKLENFQHIALVYSCDDGHRVGLSHAAVSVDFEQMLKEFKFADGKPFGIKED